MKLEGTKFFSMITAQEYFLTLARGFLGERNTLKNFSVLGQPTALLTLSRWVSYRTSRAFTEKTYWRWQVARHRRPQCRRFFSHMPTPTTPTTFHFCIKTSLSIWAPPARQSCRQSRTELQGILRGKCWTLYSGRPRGETIVGR